MWFRQETADWQSSFWQDGFWQRFAGRFSWQDFAALRRQLASDEDGLRRKVWRKLRRGAANMPFIEDALTAHYCAFDRQTPIYVKAALVGAVVYLIVPDDLIPDSIPVLGVLDDAAVMAAAMKLFSNHIKPEHREGARRALARMRG